MTLREFGAAAYRRLLNLYTLRGTIVAAVVAIAGQLPPEVMERLRDLADAAGLGYRAKLVLALFGGGYVIADLIRKNRKAVPEASPAFGLYGK